MFRVFLCLTLLVCCAVAMDLRRSKQQVEAIKKDPVHIVGGTDADPNAWGWQVLLLYRNRFICGGTLITPDTVLTAAHCISNSKPKKLAVVGGEYNRKEKEQREQKIGVSSIIVHKNYDDNTLENDLALIKLKRNVNVSNDSYVKIIPGLVDSDADFQNSICFVTGWGVYKGANKVAKILQEVNSTVLSNEECKCSVDYPVTDDMICANNEPEGACYGDSGGPLQCLVGGQYVHAGIVSWGNADCTNGPTVYASTSYFRDWIDNNINYNTNRNTTM